MGGLLATNAAACGHSFLFLKAKKLYHVTQIWEAPWGDVIIGKCHIPRTVQWNHGRTGGDPYAPLQASSCASRD